ncbi:MAG: ABC transporter permease, partial [Acidimicrobiia bacterium]
MLRFIWLQLRGRASRSLALLVGVLVATTGFTVLTASTETSALEVVGTVERNLPAAYDILVRPRGARIGLEERRGVVRPNHLSGQFGGITPAQYERIKRLPGVQVAAPIAMVGYSTTWTAATLDLTGAVDRGAVSQVIRLRPTWVGDRGLTRAGDVTPRYVYVTRRPLEGPEEVGGDPASCGVAAAFEVQEDGSKLPICGTLEFPAFEPGAEEPSGLSPEQRADFSSFQLLPDGRFVFIDPSGHQADPSPRLVVPVGWPLSLLLAAVDPEQEARLVGLDRAVVSGRYLKPGERTTLDQGSPVVPVIVPGRPYLDEQLIVDVERITESSATQVNGVRPSELRPRLERAPGTRVARPETNASDAYGRGLDQLDHLGAQLSLVVQSGSPTYETQPGGALRPLVVEVDPAEVWQGREHQVAGEPVPWLAQDVAFRPLTHLETADFPW